MKYIFGNWKMYLDLAEARQLAVRMANDKFDATQLTVAVFPNYLAIADVANTLASTMIGIGAQNCTWVSKGAYTGEVSAHFLKDAGCEYALVGHSERRHLFGETDVDVRKKIEACLDAGLIPVICIGETKGEKESGRRDVRLREQVAAAFTGLAINGSGIFVAYEPVWAIGTGIPCLPEDVDDVHGWLREELKKYCQTSIPLLYGGSVDAKNVVSYLSQDAVDGVLVGGASSKHDTFSALLKACQTTTR